MMGFRNIGSLLSYFSHIPKHLRNLGYEIYLTQTEASDGSTVRAETLARQLRCILRRTGHEKLHLVGHSQGGLDARRIAADQRYGSHIIASVTTIATPHRGTAIADAYLELAPDSVDPLLDAVLNIYGIIVNGPGDEANFRLQVEEMSTAAMVQFNEDFPDHPDIEYRSWAGRSVPNLLYRDFGDELCNLGVYANPHRLDFLDPLFRIPWQIIRDRDGINDGLVSIRSAQWGDFQGCVPADHIDEVGLIGDLPRDPFSGFEYLTLFERVAEAM
jgi:triacylglycerol lipase